jgi:tetratricopeptide (TPR) repeat protein
VDPRTRRELKQDEFKETIERFEDYFRKHAKEVTSMAIIVIVVVGAAVGLRYYLSNQEATANIELGAALRTFRAYVGTPQPGMQAPDMQSFPTAQDKYKAALTQFQAIVKKYHTYPRPKAEAIAQYHVGICQALLGDEAAAIKTLEAASRGRDHEIAALAEFALADEYLKTGKTADAVKLYQALADHPTLTVPRATALMAMADAFRTTHPQRARQIYEQVQKEFGSDATIAEALKQQIASLPQ